MIDSLTLPCFLSLAFLFTCWWIGNCFGMMIDRYLYAEMSMRSANMDPSPYWYNKKTAPSSNDIQIRCFTFEIGDLSNDEKITISKCFFCGIPHLTAKHLHIYFHQNIYSAQAFECVRWYMSAFCLQYCISIFLRFHSLHRFTETKKNLLFFPSNIEKNVPRKGIKTLACCQNQMQSQNKYICSDELDW